MSLTPEDVAACEWRSHSYPEGVEPCDCEARLATVVVHNRAQYGNDPAHCQECSAAVQEWVSWDRCLERLRNLNRLTTVAADPIAALIHEYAVTRGDLSQQYARDQLRDHLAALLAQAVETAREEGAGDLDWHRRDGAREALVAAADEMVRSQLYSDERAINWLRERAADIRAGLRERGGVS